MIKKIKIIKKINMDKYEWFNLIKTNKLTDEHINEWFLEGNSINDTRVYGLSCLLFINQIDLVILLTELTNKLQLNIGVHEQIWEMTALMLACACGYNKITHSLIKVGADINYQNRWRWTALMVVCFRCHYEVVRLLIEKGANPYLLDNEGKSAYDWANKDIKQLILEKHPNIININTRIIKKYINKQNKNILNIKRINTPYNKLI